MHLVASVCLSVRLSVCLFVLSQLNQFKVFVCVSPISGCMRIIALMRSIGVLIVKCHQLSLNDFFVIVGDGDLA